LAETPLAAVVQPPQPAQQYTPPPQTYAPPAQPYPQPAQPAAGYAAYQPTSPTAPPPYYPQVNPNSLKSLFVWCLVLLIIGNIGSAISSLIFDTDAAAGVACFVSAVAVAGTVLMLILLHRFWKLIQDGYASTTPGKAVGYLFIPFFNYYWIFKAVLGLSKDLNTFIDRHFPMANSMQVRRSQSTWALIYCILFIVNLVLGVYTYSESYSSSYYYSYSPEMYTISIVSAIFTLIYATFLIITLTDLYKTSQSILENLYRQQ
jgi:uncharacterized membrane protein